MDTTFIYALSDPRTSKVRYIGKSNWVEKRYINHLYAASRPNPSFHVFRWIRQLLDLGLKPGVEVLLEVPYKNWQEAEKFMIAHYKQFCDLTNMSEGGDGDCLTDESIEKIRQSHIGRKHTKEHRENNSKSKMGNIPWNKGLRGIYSEETLEKMRGRVKSLEEREKSSKVHKGRIKSIEEVKKISEGVRRSSYIMGLRKPVYKLDKDTGEILGDFISITEAARQHFVVPKSIGNCICGRSKTAGGFRWRFV